MQVKITTSQFTTPKGIVVNYTTKSVTIDGVYFSQTDSNVTIYLGTATQKAWKSLGKTFVSLEAAKASYKNKKTLAAIEKAILLMGAQQAPTIKSESNQR